MINCIDSKSKQLDWETGIQIDKKKQQKKKEMIKKRNAHVKKIEKMEKTERRKET